MSENDKLTSYSEIMYIICIVNEFQQRCYRWRHQEIVGLVNFCSIQQQTLVSLRHNLTFLCFVEYSINNYFLHELFKKSLNKAFIFFSFLFLSIFTYFSYYFSFSLFLSSFLSQFSLLFFIYPIIPAICTNLSVYLSTSLSLSLLLSSYPFISIPLLPSPYILLPVSLFFVFQSLIHYSTFMDCPLFRFNLTRVQ